MKIKDMDTDHISLVYIDSRVAFILKPTLQPSEYFGRRPVHKIKKGIPVGVPVIRGFDWRAWGKLHPSKQSKAASEAEEVAPRTGIAEASKSAECDACKSQQERPQVKDLVLVIHGIGQKLSERVESFHFTHAINAFRRSVNIELNKQVIKNVLRDDLSGISKSPPFFFKGIESC